MAMMDHRTVGKNRLQIKILKKRAQVLANTAMRVPYLGYLILLRANINKISKVDSSLVLAITILNIRLYRTGNVDQA